MRAPSEAALHLRTSRLDLEPVLPIHAGELHRLFGDPRLHQFVDFEVPTLEVQTERCRRWSQRWSNDARELRLNWAGRQRESAEVIAHFQASILVECSHEAAFGYIVEAASQRQGYAAEALTAIFRFLHEKLDVQIVRAHIDTRNSPSILLAQNLGLHRVAFLPATAHFKGAVSDEYVYERSLP